MIKTSPLVLITMRSFRLSTAYVHFAKSRFKQIVLYPENLPYNKFFVISGWNVFDWFFELVDWGLKLLGSW
ncbi:hypothetical protein [Arcicella rigui]|uniref:Uncharacterized protein n=1 Tax=Arcicella rigui TaxID=797020 RepID=A0ABU5QD65_9BACT|nr:hypothetical protein [Arcicella rigui]MEA5140790.1 hypothetical protein [Arcicella rigui]